MRFLEELNLVVCIVGSLRVGWKNVLVTDEKANLNEIRSTDSEVKCVWGGGGRGGYDVMDMNSIQTSHVKASLKQKMCRAEGRNYYLDIEMHKCVILVNDQLDAHFSFRICLFQISTCFENSCAHHQ
jgi:hypothetical protein